MPYNIYDDKGRKIGEVRSKGEEVVGGILGVLLAFVIGLVILFIWVAHDLASLYWGWATTIHHITPYQDLNGIITITSLVGVSALIFVLAVFLTGGEGIVEGKKVTLSKAFESFIVAQILMYFILISMAFLFAWSGSFPPNLKSMESLNALFIGTQAVVAVTPFLSLFKRFAKFSVLIFMLLEFLVSCSALSSLAPK
jgi:hypothetical protein